MSLTRLFCDTDDFCKWFGSEWEKTQLEEEGKKRRVCENIRIPHHKTFKEEVGQREIFNRLALRL